MQRTPPTIDRLKEIGERFLSIAKDQLRESKNVVPCVLLGDSIDSSPDILMTIDPRIMGDNEQKNILSQSIKSEIAEHGFNHVLMIQDNWAMHFNNKREMQICQLLQTEFGLGLPEISAAGLGQLIEQVSCMIQCIDRTIVMEVVYHRDDDGNVTSFEDMTQDEPKSGTGRFIFF